MYYSKYSDYSPEQIIDESYENICNLILEGCKNEEIKEKVHSILYEGGYEDFSVSTEELHIRNNPFLEGKRRIGFAYLLATHPETFEILRANHIDLFHGTNSNALLSILKYGLQSVDWQSDKGIETLTGEEWSRRGRETDYISVTNDIDLALYYSDISPKKGKNGSFGMVLGMSSENLNALRTCKVDTILPEIGIVNGVSPEYIKTIAVPEEKVDFVRKLVGNLPITIIPININEKFYYVDLDSEELMIDSDKANDFIKGNMQTQTKFGVSEIADLARTRKMSGLQDFFEKAKSKIQGLKRGEDNERN